MLKQQKKPMRQQKSIPDKKYKYVGPYASNKADAMTGSWRLERPIINVSDCMQCGICINYCPCGVISKDKIGCKIDYTYCKGCGICIEICPKRAINFIDEEKAREATDNVSY